MKFILSTDAGADLDLDYIADNNIKVLSMSYVLKGLTDTNREYSFGNGEAGLSITEFYERIMDGVQAKTSLVSVESHKDYFCELLKEGNDILHIPISSGLSGTAQCAKTAADEINKANPSANIKVVDFLGASMGQGLFVDYLAELRNQGKTISEAIEWAESRKLSLCHYFTVDSLSHLRRGGRVSGAAAFLGGFLQIKPILHMNDEGKLIPIGRVIGRKKSLMTLVDKMKLLANPERQRIFISHGNCPDDAQFLADKITASFGITDIKIGYIGPIIGAHSGPGTIALFFFGDKR